MSTGFVAIGDTAAVLGAGFLTGAAFMSDIYIFGLAALGLSTRLVLKISSSADKD